MITLTALLLINHLTLPAHIIYALAREMLNITCKLNPPTKTLYLTFDDGPTPGITLSILSTLKYFGARATFFCTGQNIQKHPAIFDRILNDGHMVGNHTYSHPDGWRTSTAGYIIDVERNQAFYPFRLFRPPFGRLGFGQWLHLKKHYKIILWDVMGHDFDASMTPQKSAHKIISKVGNGSVIVLHDIEKSAKNCIGALPLVLENFCKKGFEFASLPEI